MKTFRKTLLTSISLLIGVILFAQPANDNCATATNLGTLPTPNACSGGSPGVGAVVNTTGTNNAATAANPYTYLLGCQGGGDQPAPALDVWYTFVASGNEVVINITPSGAGFLPNPAITFWSGSCGNLTGRGCKLGTAAGNNTVTFGPTTPGQTYYIQVSGNSMTSTGNFNMSVRNNNDCAACNITSNLVASPAPTNGTYPPNTSVTFCYTVSNWATTSANWLNGITPIFGCGWDLATLTAGTPPVTQGTLGGVWKWYNSVTSGATGQVFGPGFYFDLNLTNNPGTSYGDYATGTWTFCWTIKTKPVTACNGGCKNLSMSINSTGDGESGSWGSLACVNDPNYPFSAMIACCSTTAAGTNPSCGGTNGTATATPLAPSAAPYTYSWSTAPVQTTQTATGLPAGTYTVTVTDKNGCFSTANAVLVAGANPTVNAGADVTICNGNSTTLTAGASTGGGSYTWSPATGLSGTTGTTVTASPTTTTTYTVTYVNGSCTATDQVVVTVTPKVTPTFNPIAAFCRGTAAPTLPASSTNGIPGTWSPATVSNTASGTYTFTPSAGQCATTATLSITVNPLPTPTITPVAALCLDAAAATLVGSPTGGTFSGTGVSGTTFNPTTAGVGAHTITYNYTDGNGCSASTTTSITVKPKPTFTVASTNPTVCGGTDGTITLSGLTPSTAYSVSYNNGATTVGPTSLTSSATGTIVITGLSAGSYSNFVVTLNGCSTTVATPVTLVDPSAPTVNAGADVTICIGNSTTLTATPSLGGGSYTWSPATGLSGTTGATVTASPTTTTTYTVTYLRSGCTATDQVVVTVTPKVTPTFNPIAAFCRGTAAPTLPASSTNGIPGTWSPATVSNTASGTYTFTPSAGQCATTAPLSITVNPLPTPTITPVATLCLDAAAVTLVGSPTGGTFSGAGVSGTTFNPTTAGAGAHTITYNYTDGNGCSAPTTTSITVKPKPTFSVASTNPTVCGGTDGTITLSGLTPSTTYSVSYNNGATTVGPTSLTSSATGTIVITGLSAGSYSNFVVTLNGCSTTVATPVTLVDPSAPTVNAGADVTICIGNSTTLTATPSLGGGSYTWSPATGLSGTTGASVTASPTTTTTYTVTYLRSGCTATDQVMVTVTPKVTPTFNPIAAFCNGTAAPTLPASSTNGIPGTWSPATVSNTASGTYTFTPSAGQCATTATLSITVNPLPTPTITPVAALCLDAAAATLVGSPTGGTFSGAGVSGTTFNPTTAGAGAHTITYNYTDGNGCSASTTTSITVMPMPTFTVASTNPTVCGGTDGTITLSGLTANTAYSVTYNNGATTVGPTSLTSSATGTIVITGLSAGSYSNFVVTLNGCSTTVVTPVTLVDPSAPTVNAGADVTICIGNSTTLTATPSLGGGSYTWSPATGLSGTTGATVTASPTTTSTYTVTYIRSGCTATDQVVVTVTPKVTPTFNPIAAFCNGTAAPTLPASSTNGIPGTWSPATVSNTASGTYTFTPSAGQCATTATLSITVNPLPTPTITPVAALCLDAAAVTLVGSPTGGTFSGTGVSGTTFNPTTAGAGAHTITYNYTDGNGCSASTTTSITVMPMPTFTVASTSPTTCGGTNGTITLSGLTANTAYSVTYNNGATTVGPATMTSSATGTIVITGLSSGTYSNFVVSLNGCSTTVAPSVTLVDPSAPIVNAGVDQTVCSGTSVTLTASNPNGAAITWDNGVTNATAFTPAVGSVTYTVTANLAGCISTDQVVVVVNPLPTPTITPVADICSDAAAFTVVGAPTGGTFSGAGMSGTTFNPATAGVGTHTITYNYTDGNSCSASTTTSIIVKPKPVFTVASTNPTTCGGTNGTVTLSGLTPNTAYSVSYNNGATTVGPATMTSNATGNIVISGLSSGTYSNFTVDLNGCVTVVSPSVTLVDPSAPTVNAGVDQTVCSGTSVTLTATNPNGAAITWNNAVTNGTGFTPAVGTLTYTVTANLAGCISTDQVDVTVNPLPTATIAGTMAICQNGTSPTITFTGANSTAPYTFTYNIDGGANQTVISTGTTATVTAPTTTAGTFTYNLVSVTDASSTTCLNPQTGSAVITVNPLPTATIAGTTAICQNGTPPTITFTGATGTANYTFTYTLNGGANQTVTSTGATATVTVPTTTAGTFTYNLVSVTDASSTTCSNPQTGSAIVTVNPLPTAIIAGTAAICQNGTAPTITFTGANGTANYTFTYNINGGANQTVTSTGTTATVTAPTTTAGTFTYNLVSVTDASSTTCLNPQTGSAIITVNPLPTATIAGTAAICQNGTSPIITFTGANGTANYTFTYNINGGANQTVTSIGATATVSAPTTTAGTFTYNLVSVADASSTACSNPQTGSSVITVNPMPSAAISGSATVCQNGTSPIITFTGAGGTAPYIFTYTLNGSINQTITSVGNTATITIPTTNSGTYSYNLVSLQDGSSTACSNPQTGNATVTVNPLPNATSAGATTVCQNDTQPIITFTGNNSSGNYTFTYTLNGGASQTITSVGTTATISAPTTVAGTFTYALTNVADPATTCNQNVTGTQVIVVNPLPTATIAGTTTLCQGAPSTQITFTGAAGTSTYQFTYTMNGGAPQTITSTGNTATITVPTTTAGTYSYVLTSVKDVTTGCFQTQSGTATVVINQSPTATASGTVSVCQDATAPSITFTGQNSSGQYAFSYTLNGGAVQVVTSTNGSSATVTQPTSVPGTYVYNLVNVMDPASLCNQNLNLTETITVNQLPTASISSPAAACYMDAILPEVVFTGADGTNPYTFTYNINGGANQYATSTGSTSTFQVPTNAVGTYTYTITNVKEGGVLGCQQLQNQSTVVTIHALPIVSAGADQTICATTQIVLTGSGAQTYVWDNGVVNGTLFTPTDTTIYTVIGTDNNGCKNTDQMTVNVVPIPVMNFDGINLSGCDPVTPTFTNHSTGNLTTCTWYLGNGEVLQGCTAVTPTFNSPGCYDVTLVVSTPEGCTNSLTLNNYVCVYPQPVAVFHPNPSELHSYQWTSQMENQSLNADSYKWNFGDDSGISTAFSPSHAFPNETAGSYTIMLVASNVHGCVDTSYVTIRLTDDLLFYIPNTFTPDGDEHNNVFQPIFTRGFDPYDYTLLIFNRWGEQIFESHDATIGWNGTYGAITELCQDGTYTWKIEVKTTANDERKMFVGHVNLLR